MRVTKIIGEDEDGDKLETPIIHNVWKHLDYGLGENLNTMIEHR